MKRLRYNVFHHLREKLSHIFSEYLVIGSTLVFHWGAFVFVSRHEPAGKKQGMWISWSKSDTLAQNIFRTNPRRSNHGHYRHALGMNTLTLQRGVTGTARIQ
jgi:hypothetical protein